MTKSCLDYALISRIQLSPNYVLQAHLLSNIRMMHINDQNVGHESWQDASAVRVSNSNNLVGENDCNGGMHLYKRDTCASKRGKTYVIVI